MTRILFTLLLTGLCNVGFAQYTSPAQSDHNTPLIELAACNCATWHSSYLNIDSTRRKLREVNYTRGGVNFRRTYYATLIDSTWTDVCDQPINCKSNTRVRVTHGIRTWFTDISTRCDITTFVLPCCTDRAVNVKDIANISSSGTCAPVFSPERLTPPTEPGVYSRVETVTASVSGKTMTATITLINPNAATDRNNPALAKLTRINEAVNSKLSPALARANDLLKRNLRNLGNWQGEVRTDFRINGTAASICCTSQPNCVLTSYSLAGEGKPGLTGRIAIPMGVLPVVGRYLTGADVNVRLGVSLNMGVNGRTTCTDSLICSNGEGPMTGGGAFSFKVAGFRTAGEVVVQGGGLGTEMCVWPEADVKCVKFNSGKLRLKGTVEDRWGFTQWEVDYPLWNGFSTTLNGCK